MAKFPKFMIAQNPMAEPDGVYIYHSQKPRFLAKMYNSSYEIVDDIDNMLEYYSGDVHRIEGIINRMSEWYKSYKIHKNGRKDREGFKGLC